jgi:ElaB/YqjD/DUF883 family membrane-anchored ribosome-binding protein
MATTPEDRAGVVEQAQQKGEELVSQAQEQAQQKAQELRVGAGAKLREQVDERSTQAGEQVLAVSDALKRSSEQLRTEGKASTANVVEQVARRAEDFGGYLKGTNADAILGDIEDFARRRPWLTGGIAAAAGFVASRFVKASSARRYQLSSAGLRSRSTASQSTPYELPAGSG